MRLGANHYYATSDPETLKTLSQSFNLMINTISIQIDLNSYLLLLAVDGVMVNIDAPPKPLSLHVFSLIDKRRSFVRSLIGSIKETQEMLDFCAEHKIGSEIEVISTDQINETYERVLKFNARL